MPLAQAKSTPLGVSAPEEKEDLQNLIVIPDVFYGGIDPEIYQEKTIIRPAEEVKVASVQPKKIIAPTVSPNSITAPVSLWKTKKFLVPAIIFFVMATGGIVYYYLNQAGFFASEPILISNNQNVVTVNTVVPTTTNNIIETAVPTTTEIIEETPTTTEENEGWKLEFPAVNLVDRVDMDQDSLTDEEEVILGTDSGIWDTDQDGYYDGQEVANLYNPKGFAPIKIIDSGLVQEYVNPVWQYRLYYPVGWTASGVDPNSDVVLLSALNGDYVEIVSLAKNSTESFGEWFGRTAVNQSFIDLVHFTNRFQVDGWHRQDSLVDYFSTDNRVYVLTYHSSAAGAISYRHLMMMVAQSFRPTKTNIEIPDQVILAPETNTTTVTNTESVVSEESTSTEGI